MEARAGVVAAGGGSNPPPPPPTGTPDVEPNDSIGTAQPAREGVTIAGTLATSNDVDVFRVSIKPGSTLGAKMTPNPASNFDVAILDGSGRTLSSSTGTGLGALDATSVRNNGTATVTWFVRVTRAGGAAGAYSLVID